MDDDKEINTPKTKSFDEEYGRMMQEDIRKHQEENQRKEEEKGSGETEADQDAPDEDSHEDEPEPKKKKRRKKHGCLIAMIVVIGVAALIIIANTPLFSVKNIEVRGNRDYSSSRIVEMSGIEKGDNIFRISRTGVDERIRKNSYVKSVKIQMKLPHTMIIQITERKAVAFLPYGSRNIIVDKDGYVMKVGEGSPKLTEISGMTVKKMSVGSKAELKEQEMFSSCLGIISLMNKNDVFFKRLDPGKVLIKAYIYDDLVCRGTPKNLSRAIKDGTLKQILSDLYKKKTKKGTVYIGSGDYISFSPKVERKD